MRQCSSWSMARWRCAAALSLGSRLKAIRNGAAAASVGRRSGSHTMLCFILVRGRIVFLRSPPLSVTGRTSRGWAPSSLALGAARAIYTAWPSVLRAASNKGLLREAARDLGALPARARHPSRRATTRRVRAARDPGGKSHSFLAPRGAWRARIDIMFSPPPDEAAEALARDPIDPVEETENFLEDAAARHDQPEQRRDPVARRVERRNAPLVRRIQILRARRRRPPARARQLMDPRSGRDRRVAQARPPRAPDLRRLARAHRRQAGGLARRVRVML